MRTRHYVKHYDPGNRPGRFFVIRAGRQVLGAFYDEKKAHDALQHVATPINASVEGPFHA